jgi:hypothetical protein
MITFAALRAPTGTDEKIASAQLSDRADDGKRDAAALSSQRVCDLHCDEGGFVFHSEDWGFWSSYRGGAPAPFFWAAMICSGDALRL